METGTSPLSAALSDAIFEAMVNVIPTVAVIADQRVILRASRHGAAMTGWEPGDVEGLTIADFCGKSQLLDANGGDLLR
jgi:PAS domain-containing protein